MNDTLKHTLESSIVEKFPNAIFDYSADEPSFTINASQIHECIGFLKSNEALSFNYLTLLGAIHYPDKPSEELCMVYHLHSWKHNQRIRVKTNLSIDNPEIDTITDIFTGANWLERETYDFFGVRFTNHPNLRRILNEDSMDYFPMRKEYHLEDDTREDKDDRFFGRF
ncbi:MAG: NADH-quinone oxidoreductase subunit C [Bacteroidetes bacterium]|nr:NADH-quinone oxidoreductase subunit C [Bacteroidota bacterium]